MAATWEWSSLRLRQTLCTASSVATLLLAPSAFGAGSAQDKAAAEALFDEGVKLLKAGKYDEACAKLDSSQRSDPGIGTLLYLGECYEKQGKTASAWATFREAASMAEAAGQSDRAQKGQARADRLMPALSKLTIVLDSETAKISGLEVRRGAETVSSALLGTAVPIDPGTYLITVTAPGYEKAEKSVVVEGKAASASVEIPPLVKLPEEPKPEPVVAVKPAEPPPPAAPPAPPGETQRTLAYVAGGLGVVGLGAGGVFGILALSKNGESDCNGTICLTQAGEAASKDAANFAQIADIAFIAGGALLATGVVLYVTAPSAESSTAYELRTNGSTLTFQGRF